MQCKTCDYRLWSLKPGACPECGAAFKPSDFEFVPNTVKFCCPHCQQNYYGNTPRGHLNPLEFDCVKCGQHIHMDQMILFPEKVEEEDRTMASGNPWLARQKEGYVKSWFKTVGWALVKPQQLMRRTAPASSINEAMWFMLVTFLAYLLPTLAFVMIATLIAITGGGARYAWMILIGITIGVGVYVAGMLVWTLIWAVSAHAILSVIAQPKHGMARTMQALYYSTGAHVLSAIPCLGVYFLWPFAIIWWAVSAIFMVREGQQVSGWRASAAVLLLPIVLLIGLFGLSFLNSSTWTPSATMSAPPTTIAAGTLSHPELTKVNQALKSFYVSHDRWPRHGLELVAAGDLMADDLLWSESVLVLDDVRVGDTDLNAFAALEQDAQQQIVTRLADALSADVVAHRLGDFVFVYHGLAAPAADQTTWLVVLAPVRAEAKLSVEKEDEGEAGETVDAFVAIDAQDVPVYATQENQATVLAEQNVQRGNAGVAPLPDPRTIDAASVTLPEMNSPAAE